MPKTSFLNKGNPTNEAIELYNSLRGSYKRIAEYSDDELEATIAVLGSPDYYRVLNFIDAYFERRKRREAAAATR